MSPREDRGRAIFERQDQISRVDEGHYLVNSQSSDKKYQILAIESGWFCSCPDHKFRKVCCKHIHAVEISIRMREKVQNDVTMPEVDTSVCRHCKSTVTVKVGIRHNASGDVQVYRCRGCGRKFSSNLGFEKMRATPEQITIAMNNYFNGESSRKVVQSLSLVGVKTTHVTVQNWIKKYINLMDQYLDKLVPQVGELWRTDEIYLKIKGDRKYLFAMLDSETRFWLAQMVADHKGNDDVAPMFAKAKKVAGKVPEILVSDGASNFHNAWKKQFKPKNFLHKKTEHRKHIHMAGDTNNNQMESFNGNTLRAREKVARSVKSDDSVIIPGVRIHHNFIRPHQSMKGDTPADRAGLRVMGDNPWKTIIQNAARSKGFSQDSVKLPGDYPWWVWVLIVWPHG